MELEDNIYKEIEELRYAPDRFRRKGISSGKIAFECGNLEKATEFFAIACHKSDGRCFEDVDRIYIRFF